MRTCLLLRAATVLVAAGFALPTPSVAQPTVTTEIVIDSGLSNAIGLTHAGDGSNRLFIVEQTGRIMVWTGGMAVLPVPFLDISTLTNGGGESGLLGLAFHPSYATNGLFYVNYTDLAGDTVVARYQVSAADPNVADPASAAVILAFDQPFGNHNGGDLHFGPDGYLYVSSGDGGLTINGQDRANLLGKILRIDVDGTPDPGEETCGTTVAYGIPDDNPQVGTGGDCDEIWALGLCNPWRMSFDRLTGDLWIGDVGEGAFEEVDLLLASDGGGANYGWPCYEGDAVFDGCGMPSDFDFPVLTLPHPPNCSVIGGFRYRGTDFPLLQGWYFYSDWCSGLLSAAEPDGAGGWTAYDLLTLGGFQYTGFGESEAGELYLAGGFEVFRIVDPTDAVFADGFTSGDTSAWSASVGGGARSPVGAPPSR